MKTSLTTLIIITLIFTGTIASAATFKNKTSVKTSAQKQAIIRQSILKYKGTCPCPWNTMENGRSCGKTSAWSKPGGAQPVCYEWEIK